MSEALLREILSEVSGIKKDITDMKLDIQALKQGQESMKLDIQVFTEEQSQIKQAVLETNEHVKQLTEKQNKQYAIIDVLSSRSIEQEAMLKRIH